jgi:ABC-type transport system substrate-binding protein
VAKFVERCLRQGNLKFLRLKVCLIFFFSVLLNKFTLNAFAVENLRHITATIPNKLDTYVPWELKSLPDVNFASLIYEPLFRTNSSGELEPIIAKSWDVSSQELRVSLRADRVFSDGTEITAQVVVESFKQLCLNSNLAKNVFSSLTGCDVGKPEVNMSGQKEVTFRVNDNPRLFLQSLAHPQALIFKHDVKGKPFAFVGSGPYRLVDFSPQYANLAVNVKSFKTYAQKNAGLRLVYVDIFELKKYLTVNTPDAILMNLSTFLKDIKPVHYKRIDHSPFVTEVLSINSALEPFASNPQLIQTLKDHLYNLSKVHECFPNEARRAYGFVPIGLGGSIADSAPQKLSSEKSIIPIGTEAKKHGMKSIVIYQHAGRKQPCVIEKVQEAFAAVGLKVQFEHLTDYPKLFSIYQDKKTPAVIELTAFVQRDVGQILGRLSPKSSFSIYFYKSLNVAGELEKARKLPKLGERFSFYRNIVKDIQENSGVIPLYYLSDANLYRNCITGHEEQGLFNPNTYLQIHKLNSGECK